MPMGKNWHLFIPNLCIYKCIPYYCSIAHRCPWFLPPPQLSLSTCPLLLSLRPCAIYFHIPLQGFYGYGIHHKSKRYNYFNKLDFQKKFFKQFFSSHNFISLQIKIFCQSISAFHLFGYLSYHEVLKYLFLLRRNCFIFSSIRLHCISQNSSQLKANKDHLI